MAFFSLKPAQVQELDDQGDPAFLNMHTLLERPRLLLATILISNNTVNIAIIILATEITGQLVDVGDNAALGFFVDVVAVTFILVLLGEVIPKIYANQNNLRFASLMSTPMLVMRKITYPLGILLVRYSSLIERRIQKKGHEVSITELRKAIEITSESGTTDEEQKILQGIVNFGNITVKQIMTSRLDVEAYSLDTPFEELVQEINKHRYSRLPIYEDNFDRVVGVLYIKDLIPHLKNGNNFKWQELVRPPYFVPERKMIDDLLREFQSMKVHLAVVVDEYGGTSGIVTLEDVLEEIVGEINDEFDEDDIFYSKLDDTTYVFDGKTALTDVVKVMELPEESFDPIKGEAETLGGLVVEYSGRIPQLREEITYNGFTFTVESRDRKRVRRVKLAWKQAEHEE